MDSYHHFGKIIENEIVGNTGNGILCEGNFNEIKIIDNRYIGLNLLAGIKVGTGAHINIKNNLII